MVDRDEPLLGRAEDHRLLAPPAVRIAVRERLLVEEMAGFSQLLHDHGIGGEDLLAGQPVRGIRREAPRLVDRAQDGKPVRPAGLVVFRTMPGGGVHQPGAVLDADILGQHDRARRGR